MKFSAALVVMMVIILSPSIAVAQNATGELAATLEVLSPGVEVLRVNTVNWVTVKSEAIVGVGDKIRTGESGRARVTFFQDGTDAEILANTTYRIVRFEGSSDRFNISAEILIGQTIQRLTRLLDFNSSYDILTPGMSLVARGTQFIIRVEATGRSAMLVTEGSVGATNEKSSAEVAAEFGIRAALAEALSDVVRAKTFEELDAALDGYAAIIPKVDDTRLNVRIGPSTDFARVGTADPAEITTLIGVIESGGWYRIRFRNGFGWILASSARVAEDCAGLRRFPDSHGPEDATLYESLGENIDVNGLNPPTPEATPQVNSDQSDE